MTTSNKVLKEEFYRQFKDLRWQSLPLHEDVVQAIWSFIDQAIKEARQEGREEAVKEMKKAISNPTSTVFNVGRNDWETEGWKGFAIDVLTQKILTNSKRGKGGKKE